MSKVFKKLFKKRAVADGSNNRMGAVVPRPKYDFVEQYTIIDPKRVLIDYGVFSLCGKIPVACEESAVSSCGFRQCIELPTNLVFSFLMELKDAPAETIINPKMRTISMVHLTPDCMIFIKPNLQNPKMPTFYRINSKGPRQDWVLYVTPEKNRAIVEQLKIHTR